MKVNKEGIRYILQFFFDKGENASQAAVMVNGTNTIKANYVQFWFRRFRSGNFDVKENVDKITAIIEVDRHVSRCGNTQQPSFKLFAQKF